LKEGSKVAEIGSGAGYFALKLASMVGSKGSVFAIDILKEPLAFLWIRARVRRQSQLQVILGDQDDPHLLQGLDAVLIANTYHEFKNPQAIADRVFQALRPGGRLVVADRGPEAGEEALSAAEAHQHHERSPEAVEHELVTEGFELVSRQDGFIFTSPLEHAGDRPDLHPWWLIVVRRPY
jgi:predicted methyltransferase